MKTTIYVVAVMVGSLAGSSLHAQSTAKDAAQQQGNSTQQKDSSKSNQSSSQQSSAGAQEGKSLTLSQLPEPVQKAFKTHAGEFNLENIQKRTIDGQTAYQASFDHGNMRSQMAVAEDGSILRVQQTRDFALGAVLPEVSATQQQQKLQDLPKSVQEAIQKASGPQVESISKETLGGKTVYRAGFNQGAVHTDLFIAENGDIVAQSQMTALALVPLVDREQVSLSSAPEAVQRAIKEQAGAQQITDLDKGKWKGQTAYKAKVLKKGQEQQLIVAESGQILNQSGGGQITEAAGAQTGKMQLQDLPRAAQDKVREEIGSGKIQSIEKSTQDGQTVYNVQCEKDGQQKTLRVSEDGKMMNQ